jgi:hypothetical protein
MIPNETLEALVHHPSEVNPALLRLLVLEIQRERRLREELQTEVARLRRSLE